MPTKYLWFIWLTDLKRIATTSKVCMYIYIVIGNANRLDHIKPYLHHTSKFDQFGSQPFFFAKKTTGTESLGPQKWSESQFSWGKWALTIGCGENMGKPHFEQFAKGSKGMESQEFLFSGPWTMILFEALGVFSLFAIGNQTCPAKLLVNSQMIPAPFGSLQRDWQQKRWVDLFVASKTLTIC